MNRFVVLLLSLVMALPVQALDLQGLYEQALTASRQGFCRGAALWTASWSRLLRMQLR